MGLLAEIRSDEKMYVQINFILPYAGRGAGLGLRKSTVLPVRPHEIDYMFLGQNLPKNGPVGRQKK